VAEKCFGNYSGLSGQPTPQDDPWPKITEKTISGKMQFPGRIPVFGVWCLVIQDKE
jgi:hypothetical protein